MKEVLKETKNKNQEIFDDVLCDVAGGNTTRAKTITIPVNLPANREETVFLKVYVDGVLDNSRTKTLDPYLELINLAFKGIQGKTRVDIKLNYTYYKEYVVDFDNGTYHCF